MKFIVDNMLGKSAKYLRMLGYDTIYPVPDEDEEILKIASNQNRIIITRSKNLFEKQTQHRRVILISTNRFQDNFKEIIKKLGIELDRNKLFSRCLECNNPIQNIAKTKVEDQLPPKVKEHFNKFTICHHCNKIYWKGGHTDRMLKKAKKLFQMA